MKAIAARLIGETEQILDGWMWLALWRAADSSSKELARQAELLRQAFVTQYAETSLLAPSRRGPAAAAFLYTMPPIAVPNIDLSATFALHREKGTQLIRWLTRRSSAGPRPGPRSAR